MFTIKKIKKICQTLEKKKIVQFISHQLITVVYIKFKMLLID